MTIKGHIRNLIALCRILFALVSLRQFDSDLGAMVGGSDNRSIFLVAVASVSCTRAFVEQPSKTNHRKWISFGFHS